MAKLKLERIEPTEETFREMAEVMLKLHALNGMARLDADKAAVVLYGLLEQGRIFVVRNQKKEIVGALALSEEEFWYSNTKFLQGLAFYVTPDYRGNRIGNMLLQAAKKEAETSDMILLIERQTIDKKPKRTKLSIAMETAGYIPLGYTMLLRGKDNGQGRHHADHSPGNEDPTVHRNGDTGSARQGQGVPGNPV